MRQDPKKLSKLGDLPTPSLILDRAALQRNLARMRDRARKLGVTLRPHLKTAKSATVARLAVGEGGPITVSTLAEARYFLDHGFTDITYAIGIEPHKLGSIAELMARGARMRLITDDADTAKAVASKGRALGVTFVVLIEIDSGAGRGGIAADADELIAIGQALNQPGAELAGVLTHAGQSYKCQNIGEIEDVAEVERLAVVTAAERLRAAGLPCPVVSVGSTPTALCARHLEGVTEMRPGVYMFMDLFQTGLGICEPKDIAVSVLASVVKRPVNGQMLIDAGALALSQDQSVAGYGRILGQTMRVAAVNQEHGFVRPDDGASLPVLAVGERLRVLPNHSCMMAAMHEHYHVIDGSDEVVDIWDRCHGW